LETALHLDSGACETTDRMYGSLGYNNGGFQQVAGVRLNSSRDMLQSISVVMRFGGVGLSSRCPSRNALFSLVSCVNANEETQERDEGESQSWALVLEFSVLVVDGPYCGCGTP